MIGPITQPMVFISAVAIEHNCRQLTSYVSISYRHIICYAMKEIMKMVKLLHRYQVCVGETVALAPLAHTSLEDSVDEYRLDRDSNLGVIQRTINRCRHYFPHHADLKKLLGTRPLLAFLIPATSPIHQPSGRISSTATVSPAQKPISSGMAA